MMNSKRMANVSLSLKYQISDHWDTSVAYQYDVRDIDRDKIYNEVEFDVVPYFTVGYSW